MSARRLVLALATCAAAAGCSGSFAARSASVYRDDTRQVLMARNDAIRSCYEEDLKANPSSGGRVVLHFKVQKKTGQIVEPRIDESQSTASPAVRRCVLQAVDGLKLDPPDAREGHATFSWDLVGPSA